MENRIKEQLSLFSDRMSTESLRANQLRLYFSSLAYVLVEALRRVGLAGTESAELQIETIRLRLLKIAAQVRITVRRIWIRYTNAYPWKNTLSRLGQHCAAEPKQNPRIKILSRSPNPQRNSVQTRSQQWPRTLRHPKATSGHRVAQEKRGPDLRTDTLIHPL